MYTSQWLLRHKKIIGFPLNFEIYQFCTYNSKGPAFNNNKTQRVWAREWIKISIHIGCGKKKSVLLFPNFLEH